MTKKEFNQIRTAIFEEAIKIESIKKSLELSPNVYIYELTQADKHKYIELTHKTQLNDNTIRENGFNPEIVNVKLIMTLNRATKCASF